MKQPSVHTSFLTIMLMMFSFFSMNLIGMDGATGSGDETSKIVERQEIPAAQEVVSGGEEESEEPVQEGERNLDELQVVEAESIPKNDKRDISGGEEQGVQGGNQSETESKEPPQLDVLFTEQNNQFETEQAPDLVSLPPAAVQQGEQSGVGVAPVDSTPLPKQVVRVLDIEVVAQQPVKETTLFEAQHREPTVDTRSEVQRGAASEKTTLPLVGKTSEYPPVSQYPVEISTDNGEDVKTNDFSDSEEDVVENFEDMKIQTDGEEASRQGVPVPKTASIQNTGFLRSIVTKVADGFDNVGALLTRKTTSKLPPKKETVLPAANKIDEVTIEADPTMIGGDKGKGTREEPANTMMRRYSTVVRTGIGQTVELKSSSRHRTAEIDLDLSDDATGDHTDNHPDDAPKKGLSKLVKGALYGGSALAVIAGTNYWWNSGTTTRGKFNPLSIAIKEALKKGKYADAYVLLSAGASSLTEPSMRGLIKVIDEHVKLQDSLQEEIEASEFHKYRIVLPEVSGLSALASRFFLVGARHTAKTPREVLKAMSLISGLVFATASAAGLYAFWQTLTYNKIPENRRYLNEMKKLLTKPVVAA
jgi:hypothetical protein